MDFKDIKQDVDATQSKPETILRDEFIMPNVKKALKVVKGERPIEILIYFDGEGKEVQRVEQFWIPTEQDMKSTNWKKV